MSASDSEQELDSSDVFVLGQKTRELEDVVRSLQTMEDPQMRYRSFDKERLPGCVLKKSYEVENYLGEI